MPSAIPAAHLESVLHPQDVHVLLVDDEALSRLVVGNLLRKCDYKGEDDCAGRAESQACNASRRRYASTHFSL
jgi:CheY-like chemotaxis protein